MEPKGRQGAPKWTYRAPNGVLDDHCGARRAQGGPKVGPEGSPRAHEELKRGLRRRTGRPRDPL